MYKYVDKTICHDLYINLMFYVIMIFKKSEFYVMIYI